MVVLKIHCTELTSEDPDLYQDELLMMFKKAGVDTSYGVPYAWADEEFGYINYSWIYHGYQESYNQLH